ncbi:MAG: helix-turn-helix transcriptional regulator [Paludibacteraceae bacterium]|nr:helix-turn-helix transcriptional regulator [Paludibacteraceae bacterium]
MFSASDKMYSLMAESHKALQIVSRFGLPLGVGDKTIDEVCRENGIHTPTLLSVINNHVDGEVDIPTLKVYLKNAHTYFLDYALPRIRAELIEAISKQHTHSQIPLLIIRLYDEYTAEIRNHIEHENASEYSAHAADDQHIAKKLNELKDLVIRYYPAEADSENKQLFNGRLYAALQDIVELDQELNLHCDIEDNILLPAMMKARSLEVTGDGLQVTGESQALSDREKEVLVQVVKGLSNKEIADVLCISTHTVISHRKNIARKLNIHSSAGLTIYAIVNHLVEI